MCCNLIAPFRALISGLAAEFDLTGVEDVLHKPIHGGLSATIYMQTCICPLHSFINELQELLKWHVDLLLAYIK